MKKLVTLIVTGSLLSSVSLFAARPTPQPDPAISPLANSVASWGAQNSNGVGSLNGTPLANGSGDLVMIGAFLDPTTHVALTGLQIVNASFSTLQADWVQFGGTVIGNANPNGAGSLSDGYWTGNTTASASSLLLAGNKVYYWVLNAPTFGAATQQGVFTSTAPGWVFPNDSGSPQSFSNDLNQVPTTTGANGGILWGSFGTGTSRDGTSPLYNLALIAVPEPSTLALIGFALVGAPVVFLRRRK